MNEHVVSDEDILAGVRRRMARVESLVPLPPAWEPPAPPVALRAAGGLWRTAYGLVGLAGAVALGLALILALGPLGQRGTNVGGSTAPASPSAGWTTIAYRLSTGAASPTSADLEQTGRVLRARLALTGLAGFSVTLRPPDRVAVAVQDGAGTSLDELRLLLGERGALSFVDLPAAEYGTADQPGAKPVPSEGDALPAGLGSMFTNVDIDATKVNAAYDAITGWHVDFAFTAAATTRFAAYSSANVNHYFAIVVDGVVISAPYIKAPITEGSGQISGQFTARSANRLAVVLRSGELPDRLTEVGVETGGAAPSPSASGR